MKTVFALLYAQFPGEDSLCEIENALLANHKCLYHLGSISRFIFAKAVFHAASYGSTTIFLVLIQLPANGKLLFHVKLLIYQFSAAIFR